MSRAMTVNQVVAYNLAEARRLRGWSQSEAAARIAPYLGVKWSRASFSAAERSVAGERIRQFDADEIVAFARAFRLPVLWFFLPPATGATSSRTKGRAGQKAGDLRPGELIDAVVGPEGYPEMRERLRDLLSELRPEQRSDYQNQIEALMFLPLLNVLAAEVGDLGEWARGLRDMANRVEAAERMQLAFSQALQRERAEVGELDPSPEAQRAWQERLRRAVLEESQRIQQRRGSDEGLGVQAR